MSLSLPDWQVELVHTSKVWLLVVEHPLQPVTVTESVTEFGGGVPTLNETVGRVVDPMIVPPAEIDQR